MRKLYDLRMKDNDNVASHWNGFDALWLTQLLAQNMVSDDELKCVFLLCTLPSSWDTFCTAISAYAPNSKLVYNDICGALFGEEICRKSVIASHNGDAYNVSDVGPHKNQDCGRILNRETKSCLHKCRNRLAIVKVKTLK